MASRLWAAGALGVWERRDALVAWFEQRPDEVPPGGTWEIEPDRDWQAEWKAGIGPVSAGRVTVVPTWLAEDHEPQEDELTLVLDPGRAFGSGHHATTTLCLELVQEVVVRDREVLDVGCGTGILALAAARLGAANVRAVDVDADAVEVTRENAGRNGLHVEATVGTVDTTTPPADVVLANLVTDTVVALAGRLAAAVVPGGSLVASGIASDRVATAVAAIERAGLVVEEERRRDGWSALRCRRPASTDGL